MGNRGNHHDPDAVTHAEDKPLAARATPKEKRRAARVRRRAHLHEVPLSAMPHEPEVVRARVQGAPLPSLSDLALSALVYGVGFGLRRVRRLAGRVAARILNRALPPIGRTARLVDGLSGGRVTRLF